MAVVVTLALLPVAGQGAAGRSLAVLWGLGLALVGVWGSTGLAVGVYTANRARGLVAGLCVWFGSLVLYDLATLLLAGVDTMQARPAVWTSLLLLNPTDAVRLAGMTALEGVSFTAPGSSKTVATLLAWTPVWTAVLAVGWTAAAFVWAGRRLDR